jgi:hypothetical protein
MMFELSLKHLIVGFFIFKMHDLESKFGDFCIASIQILHCKHNKISKLEKPNLQFFFTQHFSMIQRYFKILACFFFFLSPLHGDSALLSIGKVQKFKILFYCKLDEVYCEKCMHF